MHAIGYHVCLPVSDPRCLEDMDLAKPVAADRDLLIAVRALGLRRAHGLIVTGNYIGKLMLEAWE